MKHPCEPSQSTAGSFTGFPGLCVSFLNSQKPAAQPCLGISPDPGQHTQPWVSISNVCLCWSAYLCLQEDSLCWGTEPGLGGEELWVSSFHYIPGPGVHGLGVGCAYLATVSAPLSRNQPKFLGLPKSRSFTGAVSHEVAQGWPGSPFHLVNPSANTSKCSGSAREWEPGRLVLCCWSRLAWH
jgi:hypothetical protein